MLMEIRSLRMRVTQQRLEINMRRGGRRDERAALEGMIAGVQRVVVVIRQRDALNGRRRIGGVHR